MQVAFNLMSLLPGASDAEGGGASGALAAVRKGGAVAAEVLLDSTGFGALLAALVVPPAASQTGGPSVAAANQISADPADVAGVQSASPFGAAAPLQTALLDAAVVQAGAAGP